MRKSHTKSAKEIKVSVAKKNSVVVSLVILRKFEKSKMPDVDLGNRHPALQSMCSKD